MPKVRICSSGVVTKCEKGYKEIRKDPKSSHKNGTRIKGANIMKTDQKKWDCQLCKIEESEEI